MHSVELRARSAETGRKCSIVEIRVSLSDGACSSPFQQGFPELGIPVLDPLERDTMVFEYARGPLHVHVQATDIRIAGVSQTQVKAVRTTIAGDRMDAEIETHFPQLQVSGAYKSDNDYQGLRFGSAGKFNITMSEKRDGAPHFSTPGITRARVPH